MIYELVWFYLLCFAFSFPSSPSFTGMCVCMYVQLGDGCSFLVCSPPRYPDDIVKEVIQVGNVDVVISSNRIMCTDFKDNIIDKRWSVAFEDINSIESKYEYLLIRYSKTKPNPNSIRMRVNRKKYLWCPTRDLKVASQDSLSKCNAIQHNTIWYNVIRVCLPRSLLLFALYSTGGDHPEAQCCLGCGKVRQEQESR